MEIAMGKTLPLLLHFTSPPSNIYLERLLKNKLVYHQQLTEQQLSFRKIFRKLARHIFIGKYYCPSENSFLIL